MTTQEVKRKLTAILSAEVMSEVKTFRTFDRRLMQKTPVLIIGSIGVKPLLKAMRG